MLKSSRVNRITALWLCPHCHATINTRSFRFVPGCPSELICSNPVCGRQFSWNTQNKGKLWPEQRAYNVLR